MTTLAPSSARASTVAMPMPLLPPVTIAVCPSRIMSLLSVGVDGVLRSGHACEQVVPDPQGVRDGREGRVHRADAREEAGVDDVEVVELVGPAVRVEHRRGRVVTEPARAGLMADAGNADVLLEVVVLVQHVVA